MRIIDLPAKNILSFYLVKQRFQQISNKYLTPDVCPNKTSTFGFSFLIILIGSSVINEVFVSNSILFE